MKYFGKVCAFVLFVVALKFFNDGNMAWWLFMFAFIIVSGFIIGEEGIDDEQVDAILHASLPKDWEDYKARYIEDEGDDSIIVNNDAEIKYKTDTDDYDEYSMTHTAHRDDDENIPF